MTFITSAASVTSHLVLPMVSGVVGTKAGEKIGGIVGSRFIPIVGKDLGEVIGGGIGAAVGTAIGEGFSEVVVDGENLNYRKLGAMALMAGVSAASGIIISKLSILPASTSWNAAKKVALLMSGDSSGFIRLGASNIVQGGLYRAVAGEDVLDPLAIGQDVFIGWAVHAGTRGKVFNFIKSIGEPVVYAKIESGTTYLPSASNQPKRLSSYNCPALIRQLQDPVERVACLDLFDGESWPRTSSGSMKDFDVKGSHVMAEVAKLMNDSDEAVALKALEVLTSYRQIGLLKAAVGVHPTVGERLEGAIAEIQVARAKKLDHITGEKSYPSLARVEGGSPFGLPDFLNLRPLKPYDIELYTPELYERLLAAADNIRPGVPIAVWGPTRYGKSSMVAAIAERVAQNLGEGALTARLDPYKSWKNDEWQNAAAQVALDIGVSLKTGDDFIALDAALTAQGKKLVLTFDAVSNLVGDTQSLQMLADQFHGRQSITVIMDPDYAGNDEALVNAAFGGNVDSFFAGALTPEQTFDFVSKTFARFRGGLADTEANRAGVKIMHEWTGGRIFELGRLGDWFVNDCPWPLFEADPLNPMLGDEGFFITPETFELIKKIPVNHEVVQGLKDRFNYLHGFINHLQEDQRNLLKRLARDESVDAAEVDQNIWGRLANLGFVDNQDGLLSIRGTIMKSMLGDQQLFGS